MDGMFNIRSLLYKWLNLFSDVVILSLIWVFTTLIGLGITFGASTTAIYYTALNYILNKESYMIKDYIRSFKENLIQSTAIFLIIASALVISLINISNTNALSLIILPIQYFIVFEVFLISTYIYPLMAKFKMKNITLIKTAFFMANKHVFTSLICVFIAFNIFLLCCLYPPIIFISIGIYSFLTSYFIIKVFKKYSFEL